MVKARISATVDDDILEIIKSLLKGKKYRNKSHVIEIAIRFLKEKEK
ncbi:MAG TPA: ribbon-helix-helix protein, CopG family [Candidatus Nanoarchaeia archaeon]|nr:ribbon-helix-helix protein, CopG family [Candidatus Nanoarchaeia archaeon]